MNIIKDRDSVRAILTQFKAVFLDSYGVIKNHKGLIDGIEDTIKFIRDENIALRVLTNDASRSQKSQAEKFARLGLGDLEEEDIVTSGMMASEFIRNKISTGKVAYIGTSQAASYIIDADVEAIPIDMVDIQNPNDISAIVFLDDEGYDWATTINHTINLLRRINVPVVVANTDRIYPVAKNDVSLATGGIAQLVENVIGRKFIKFGKPDSQMFMFAMEHLQHKGVQVERKDILMVGDTLHTDILGGNKFGIKTALVLSGNTTERNAQLLIDATGVVPDYIFESIVL